MKREKEEERERERKPKDFRNEEHENERKEAGCLYVGRYAPNDGPSRPSVRRSKNVCRCYGKEARDTEKKQND